jgi:hypothetical protein
MITSDLYHTCFPNDRPWTRRLVYSVLFFDTLQTGFAIHNAWKLLGSGWGDQQLLLNPEWSWGSVPLFTGIGLRSLHYPKSTS